MTLDPFSSKYIRRNTYQRHKPSIYLGKLVVRQVLHVAGVLESCTPCDRDLGRLGGKHSLLLPVRRAASGIVRRAEGGKHCWQVRTRHVLPCNVYFFKVTRMKLSGTQVVSQEGNKQCQDIVGKM